MCYYSGKTVFFFIILNINTYCFFKNYFSYYCQKSFFGSFTRDIFYLPCEIIILKSKTRQLKGLTMKLRILVLLFLSIIFYSCSGNNPLLKPDTKELNKHSPNNFHVVFHTTKGDFTVDVSRKYSPLGVDRFYYLVKNHYYDGNRFLELFPILLFSGE